MTVLEMLAKVVCAEELLGLVTLAKFVHVIQMFGPSIPVCGNGKLFSAVPAHIGRRGMGWRGVEGCLHSRQRSAGP